MPVKHACPPDSIYLTSLSFLPPEPTARIGSPPVSGEKLPGLGLRAAPARNIVDAIVRQLGLRSPPAIPRSSRRKSCALRATTMVDTDINTAPNAGASVMPAHARTPAARGKAKAL